tara:strand:+ start:9471 stop:9602 length:132 start_codon:yes stop_codon:yes gene_type:complete
MKARKTSGATRWSLRFFVWWHEVVKRMYQPGIAGWGEGETVPD